MAGRSPTPSRWPLTWPRTTLGDGRSSKTGARRNVSGEPVVILAGEAMARLITAAARLAEAPLGPYAIIGGVAVSCRLGQAHRATADLDAVVDDASPPPAIEVLSQLPTAEPDPDFPHRILVEGIKVEIQGTEPFRPEELEALAEAVLATTD